jgi:FkbM family methyltransferase
MNGPHAAHDHVLDQTRRDGVSLFGAGRFARDVSAALRSAGVAVQCFLTSAEPQQSTLDGLPVRRADAAALARAPVWVGVFNREPHSDYGTVQQGLQALQPEVQLVWPQRYYGALQEALGFRFWLHALDDYASAEPAIARARALMDDGTSRAAFDTVLAFRRSAHSQPPNQHDEVQYLPTWLRAHLNQAHQVPLRIVDGGAYQGETLLELATLLPIAQAWTFEPDASNYAALVRRLADWPTPAVHLPAGLSAAAGVACFSQGEGEASHLSAQGSHQVPLVSVDESLHGAPVNFLKLDVEGHELAALAGARATLARQRPTLAIAGYHRWDDLWRIPAFIADLDLGYRIRLGLHGRNSFDAVFYAYQG